MIYGVIFLKMIEELQRDFREHILSLSKQVAEDPANGVLLLFGNDWCEDSSKLKISARDALRVIEMIKELVKK